jgi:hypothetical protein
MSDTKTWAKIDDLDLTTVKAKLKSKKGRVWKWRNDLDKLEKEYKQFLYLIAANPGETVVPWSEPMDDLWHEHILDTQKYHDDCMKIFGKYIHHNPHLPIGSASQKKAFKKTQEMYKEAFKKKAAAKKNGDTSSDAAPGCGAIMPIMVCGSGCGTAHGVCDSTAGHDGGGGHACGGGDGGGGDSGGGGGDGGGGCGGGGCGGGGGGGD